MTDKPKHFCGVAGMALTTNVVPLLRKSLRVLQHRGQESAGIAVFDVRIRSLKGMGLVREVLTPASLGNMKGNSGIGHVRYSTTGSSCAENCAPIVVTTLQGEVALAHNGDIVNADKMRAKLQAEGWAFLTTTDSEIIVRLMANELSQNPDPIRAIKNTMRIIDGAYSITAMFGGRVFGMRDPLGFRPLCIGRLHDGYGLASESAVFDVLQGEFIRDVVQRNPKNFRVFSPDETSSNRWGAVFEVTNRCSTAEILPGDDHVAPDGRVMEVLSEHQCQGWLEGYLLTGRHGFFSCYEAFIHIVDSMFNQHAKWLDVAGQIPWRRPIASLNILLSSHVWRQDHNGFSHQDPGFIDVVANKKAEIVRVYLPPDANTLLSVTDHCLRSRNYVNVIVAGK
ncbi:MAG: class II glutamine amidotransferase, partial [candidate division NC10 bacterium]